MISTLDIISADYHPIMKMFLLTRISPPYGVKPAPRASISSKKDQESMTPLTAVITLPRVLFSTWVIRGTVKRGFQK
jgi:hypothetical protein